MHDKPRCRGGVYILVLVVTGVVTSMSILGLRAAMTYHTEGRRVADSISARQLAASAMESGLHSITDDPSWRVSRPSGDWLDKAQIGEGTFTVSVEGIGGGAFPTLASEPFQLTGYGYVGDSRSILRAQIDLAGEDTRDHMALLNAKGIVASWRLSGAQGSGFEDDEVEGNSLNADWTGSEIIPGAAPGIGAGTSAWFTGAGAIEASSHDEYSDIRTVSVWFWPESVTGNQGIITRDASGRGAGGRWEIALEGTSLVGLFDSTSQTYSLTGDGVQAGQWNHAMLTVESGRLALHLNGVRLTAWVTSGDPVAISSPSETVRIGVRRSTVGTSHEGTDHFVGAIAEVALMTDSVTDDEATAIYNAYPEPATYAVIADTWQRVVE